MPGELIELVAEVWHTDSTMLLPPGQVGVPENAGLRVGGLGVPVEDPGPHVQRLGADPQGLGVSLRILADGWRSPARSGTGRGSTPPPGWPTCAGTAPPGAAAREYGDPRHRAGPSRPARSSSLLTLSRVVTVYNFCKQPEPSLRGGEGELDQSDGADGQATAVDLDGGRGDHRVPLGVVEPVEGAKGGQEGGGAGPGAPSGTLRARPVPVERSTAP